MRPNRPYYPEIESAINQNGDKILYINGAEAELIGWTETCGYNGIIEHHITFQSVQYPNNDKQTIQILPAEDNNSQIQGSYPGTTLGLHL